MTDDDKARLEVVKRTYLRAVERGDRHVYFLDGPTLMAMAEGEGTVDNCHPTDLGFASMARALTSVLEPILA
ncbi:MAG: hypothetical protein IJF73_02940 [Clostridia bacterium]|nr:hypothetical protein [Clostridia bacterium]